MSGRVAEGILPLSGWLNRCINIRSLALMGLLMASTLIRNHTPMAKLQLTAQELTRIDIFGYMVFPGLLNDRIDRIIEEFEATFARQGGHYGKAHDGTARSCILPFIDQTEYLASLI